MILMPKMKCFAISWRPFKFFYKTNNTICFKIVCLFDFRESIERTNIVFMKDGTEMSYREKRIHKFDTEFSNGSLNDTVFVPNVLILVSSFQLFLSHCIYYYTNVLCLEESYS